MSGSANARTSRSRNPRGQGDRLREALLDSATELLADLQDAQALSVRAVTAHAGVTPTALYLQFADKEELLTAVKERCFAELHRYLTAAAGGHDDPRTRLAAMGGAYLQFANERPGYYRVIFHTPHSKSDADPLDDPMSRAHPAASSAAMQALGDLIDGVARCLPPNRPAEPTALRLWAALHGYVGLVRAMPHFPFPEAGEYVRDILDLHLGEGVGSGHS